MTNNAGLQEPGVENQPLQDGDNINVGDIQNARAVAVGRGATAVYQGLSFEEVVALFGELKDEDLELVWDGRVPYLGLKAFQEADAAFFFGREDLVDDLLERVREGNRFIVIAGPSGSGKSSVARAGLFHALRQGRVAGSEKWLLATMTPKDRPVEGLAQAMSRLTGSPATAKYIREEGLSNPQALHEQAEALLSDNAGQRLVLLVDQFEEVFTQASEMEREAFIKLLTTAVNAKDGRVIVLLSLRSDFVSNCALYPDLRAQINKKNQFQLVGAMAPRDLAKAISKPSLAVGAEIEPALVKQIIDDMKGEPGALPLMSFALRDLFLAEQTEPGQAMDLTLQEYLGHGGLDEALERHANKVFDSFSDEQQELAKSIFSKLITVGEGRLDTRRTASFEELKPADADAAAVAAVVGKLADADVRLVTTSGAAGDEELTVGDLTAGQTTVTIAHEKLIDSWPWLKRLIDENRELIGLQNQIQNDAGEWAQEEDPGFLYRGGRLLHVEENWDKLERSLDEQSRRFIEGSVSAREAEAWAEAERIRNEEALKQEQANADRFRRLTKGLGVAVAVAAVATIIALFAMFAARESEAQVAELKNRIQASQLALASDLEQDKNPELALLLATAGLGMSSQPDTLASFYSASLEPFRRSFKVHDGLLSSAVFNPDGTKILTAGCDVFFDEENFVCESGSAKVWDKAGEELVSFNGHSDFVRSAVFSPNGELVATASNDGSAKVWDLAGNEVASLEGHLDWVGLIVFSPDGESVLTAGCDVYDEENFVCESGSASVWDVAGNELATLGGHDGEVKSAVFSPDGQRIVTAGSDSAAKIWSAAGEEVTSLEEHGGIIYMVDFSPDGESIVTAGCDVYNEENFYCESAIARIWDVAGNEVASLEGHEGVVRSAVFSPDGELIVTASDDGSAKVWDMEGNELASLDGHEIGTYSAFFSPSGSHDGLKILTVSYSGSVKVWDMAGTELASLGGHESVVQFLSAVFSPDGEQILTASADGDAWVWDLKGNEVASLEGHAGVVFSAVFSPDGEQIVTAGCDVNSFDHVNCDSGIAKVWDLAGNELASLEGHEGVVQLAVFSPDGEQIVTSGLDGSARIWDLAGHELARLEGHEGMVLSAVFSPGGGQILTAGWDGSARVWDLAGNELARLKGHQDLVRSAVFSPSGEQILTASADGSAKVWDTAGNELATLEGHTSEVLSAVFNPAGEEIVTASRDNSARVWDLAGNELARLEGHEGAVMSAVFSPDGEKILTASGDGSARVWDLAGNELARLGDGVRSAVFSLDGEQIVTGSEDGSVKVWDLAGNELVRFEGHDWGMVLSAVFSPEGESIVTASNDGSAKVWAIYPSIEGKVAIASQRLGEEGEAFTEEQCRRFFRDDLDSCPRTLEALWALFEDDLEGESQ